ncbi:antibiotic biosynthesis monooxygenase [Massilia arenae]|uniref:Antibiotic biosynthesis monooxygenase n=2 Tax=Massilia arenae TaxID=2603288 RepID=A0A5C7G2Y2_9BURK|nr:antibiotic biosynthesis monooxygenase [Massilia arenae]
MRMPGWKSWAPGRRSRDVLYCWAAPGDFRTVAPPLRRNIMNPQVTIIATLYAKAGQEDALAARMQEMTSETRKEAGCILYELQRSNDDPREFIMVEYWRDAEAVALHDASAHMAALVADLPALVDRPVAVRKYTPAG